MSYRDIVRKGLQLAPAAASTANTCARTPVSADTNSYATALGVALDKLVTYMTDEDFARVMECSPEEYRAMPAWKQLSLKKKLRLHVPTTVA